MKILVINPNTSQEMTREIGIVAAAAAGPGTTVECVSPAGGPASVEGFTDEVLAAYHTVELVASTRGEYDGYVIACFGDPAVAACREVADVPVAGIAEAACHLASLVAHRWSVVTVLPRVKPMMDDLIRHYGMESRCASIRCTPLSVLEIEADLERTKRLMLEQAQAAIDVDGAEAILLGCAGLGPIDKTMQAELEVPVFDGTACAVMMVENLHRYGVSTAKVRAYLAPEPKRLTSCPAAVSRRYEPSAV